MREMVRRPLDAPKMIGSEATFPHNDPERFWGTYRSGVYFGLKTRSPHSPVAGLMWMTQFTGRLPVLCNWNLLLVNFVTDCIRSMGEGNDFTPVCLSVQGEGVVYRGCLGIHPSM